MMYKVFIVEDDKTISSILKTKLDKWGLRSYEVQDFEDVHLQYAKTKPHLVLMDINLPYYDGFYWCEKIRKTSNIPIIFISSRNDDKDKIRAITGGADDYIEKPFSIDVMIAKVHAVLRRTYAYSNQHYTVMSHKGMVLDLEKDIVSNNEKDIQITRNDSIILSMLIKASGKVVSRTELMKTLWEDERFVDENTLTVNINRLRKKLKQILPEDIIETAKGKGYRLR